MNKPDRVCLTCVFWNQVSESHGPETTGECRRFPPRVNHADFEALFNESPDSSQMMTVERLNHVVQIDQMYGDERGGENRRRFETDTMWPITWGKDWCGEWRLTR